MLKECYSKHCRQSKWRPAIALIFVLQKKKNAKGIRLTASLRQKQTQASLFEVNEMELVVTVRTTLEREPVVSKCHGAFTLVPQRSFLTCRISLRPALFYCREVLWHLDGIGPTIACLTETTTKRHLPDIESARPGIVRESLNRILPTIRSSSIDNTVESKCERYQGVSQNKPASTSMGDRACINI